MSTSDSVLRNYSEVFEGFYRPGKSHDSQNCPFIGTAADVMQNTSAFDQDLPLVHETWLLFTPSCANHKQCVSCYQEADETNPKGMRWLRLQVIEAASKLISTTHKTVTAVDDFVTPLNASTRAFIAGCAIAIAISKRWVSAQSRIRDLNRCTEILSIFASHWDGGLRYLHVWRTLVDSLDYENTSK